MRRRLCITHTCGHVRGYWLDGAPAFVVRTMEKRLRAERCGDCIPWRRKPHPLVVEGGFPELGEKDGG